MVIFLALHALHVVMSDVITGTAAALTWIRCQYIQSRTNPRLLQRRTGPLRNALDACPTSELPCILYNKYLVVQPTLT